MPDDAEVSRLLPALFEAERTVRRLHAELAKRPQAALEAALDAAVRAALDLGEREEDESTLRLVRIAELLAEVQGPRAVDLLIDIMGSDAPEARHAAGEVLEELAWDRFKEVALGVERAIERVPAGSPALLELPYLLAEIPEPGVRKLLGRFLGHSDPEAVSSAIEALVEMGDPAAAPMLEALEKDTREVSLEDQEGEEGKVTLGELASEARKLLLGALGASAAPGPGPEGRAGKR